MDQFLRHQIDHYKNSIKSLEAYIEALKTMRFNINAGLGTEKKTDKDVIYEKLQSLEKESDQSYLSETVKKELESIAQLNSSNQIDDFLNSQDMVQMRVNRKNQLIEEDKKTVEKKYRDNNLTEILVDPPQISEDSRNKLFKKNPPVNRLSQYTKKKQREISYKMFLTARKNIAKMSKLDSSINDDFDSHVIKEADRLLNAYLARSP